MNSKTMKWIWVYDSENHEVQVVKGYECSMCGYFAKRKSPVCPFCKRREEEPCEEQKHG